MTAKISHEQWLAELLKVETVDGFTTSELCLFMGVGEKAARIYIRRWIQDGRVVHAGRKAITSISGAPSWAPAYRVIPKP